MTVAPDELRRFLVDERRTFTEIAERFGVSTTTVANRARGLGIESTHRRVRRAELHEGDWLRDQFAAGRSIDEVAAELGVTYGTVVNARNQRGISTLRAPKRTIEMAEVRRRLEAGESLAAIGRALGHDSAAISKAVRRSGGAVAPAGEDRAGGARAPRPNERAPT